MVATEPGRWHRHSATTSSSSTSPAAARAPRPGPLGHAAGARAVRAGPRRRRWRGRHSRCRLQVGEQAVQRRAVVHVVPGRQLVHRQADGGGGGAGLRRDALRAPGDAGVEPRVQRRHAEQVVAAILRRAEHDAVGAAGQGLRGLHQAGGGQRRAVGVQHAHRAVPAGEQRARRVQQRAAEPVHPVRHLRRAVRQQQLRAIGQDAVEQRLQPGGRVGDVAGDIGLPGCEADILRDVAQERGTHVACLVRRQRGRQAGLGMARAGCLGHDRDGTAHGRVSSRGVVERRSALAARCFMRATRRGIAR